MSGHLKSRKHLKNISQNEVIIPKKKPIKRNVKVPDIVTKDKNRYCFTDKILRKAYNIIVENHHVKNVNSKITITPNHEIIGIAEYHFDKKVIEMANIYAKLVNQYKYKSQLSFLA